MARADIEELWRRVKLILSEARSLHFYRPKTRDPWGGELMPPGDINIAQLGSFELVHEQVLLIRRLYTTVAPDVQAAMAGAIVGALDVAPPRVVTHALLAVGAIDSIVRLERNPVVLSDVAQAVVEKAPARAWRA